jgi:hypothetical protein
MRKHLRRLVLVAFTILALAPVAVAGAAGNVNFFIGQKALDSGEWDPLDRQTEIGAVSSFGGADWPIHIAVDVLVSGDDDTFTDPFVGDIDVKGSTFEIDAGVRKVWGKKATQPYLGGGLAVIGASLELDSAFGDADADDQGLGYWIDGGVFWRLGTRFNIGFDVRWSHADVDLDFGGAVPNATDLNAGGLHYGLLLGFGW